MSLLKTLCASFLGLLLFIGTSEAAPREIRVIVAVSEAFKFDPNWDRDIRDRILYVNEIFEPMFGIHFRVKEFIPWEIIDETRETSLMMEELRSFIPMGKDEIIVGFHKMSQPFAKDKMFDSDTVGSAQFFRGLVVIRDPFGQVMKGFKNLVLLHEFAHLFGAVHVGDVNAVMAPRVPGNPSPRLDEENHKIVQATRNVDFTRGIDSLPDAVIDELIRVYERMIRENPHSDFYHQLGKFYFKRGLEARAVSVWEEAVKRQYDNPYIHRELGEFYYRTGRNEQAIQSLGRAIAHYILPSQKKAKANGLNFLGVAYFRKGNYEQAIVSWLQSLTENPDDLITQGNLAVAYLQNGSVDKAISELTRLAAKKTTDATILSNLGAAHMSQGNYDEAIKFLKKALDNRSEKREHRSTKKDAMSDLLGEVPEEVLVSNLGFAYLRLQGYDDALHYLQRATHLNPKNFEVYVGLGEAYLRLQNYEEVVKVLKIAKQLRQDDPYLYVYLSQAYSQLNKKSEAKQAVQDGLRYAEGELASYLHKTLGVLYAQSRRFNEAKEEFRVALNQNWNDAESHFHMGQIHAIQGEVEKARRSFKNALRVDPQYAQATRAIEALETQS